MRLNQPSPSNFIPGLMGFCFEEAFLPNSGRPLATKLVRYSFEIAKLTLLTLLFAKQRRNMVNFVETLKVRLGN